MGNPTLQTVHVDRALTNLSTAYFQDPQNYIAGRVFPNVPVQFKTDKYFVYDKNDSMREKAQPRGPGEESAGGGFRVSTDSYSADVFAWHVDLSDQVLGNADGGLNLQRSAARQCTDAILRQMESDFANTVFKTGVWTIDLDGTTNFVKWSSANSTPLEDIETQALAIQKSTGRRPNTLVLGAAVYSKLKNHPDFIDRIRFVSDSVVTREIMARLFEIDHLYVANHAWLGYVSPSPAMEEPSAGYIFTWSDVSDGSAVSVGTSLIQIPERRTLRVESQLAWDIKITGLDLGAFFETAI
jgi:hypothetical protein